MPVFTRFKHVSGCAVHEPLVELRRFLPHVVQNWPRRIPASIELTLQSLLGSRKWILLFLVLWVVVRVCVCVCQVGVNCEMFRICNCCELKEHIILWIILFYLHCYFWNGFILPSLFRIYFPLYHIPKFSSFFRSKLFANDRLTPSVLNQTTASAWAPVSFFSK